jgi:hypothetical protein
VKRSVLKKWVSGGKELLVDYQAEENRAVFTFTDPVTSATQRLRELQASGVELYEILGGEAGATFIRDACEGDPEVGYAAIALAYYPTTHERRVGEQGEANGSEKSPPSTGRKF